MTNGFQITCDRLAGLRRTVVWAGRKIRDIYIDDLETPDMTGALVRGKVIRLLVGNKSGWVEAGLPEKIYFESSSPVRSGDWITLRIKTTMEHGKAFVGKIEGNDASFEGAGLIMPPPTAWERALDDIGPEASADLTFSDKADYDHFIGSSYAGTGRPARHTSSCAHPDLGDFIQELMEPRLTLQGGGNIVIEKTEALTVIDINAGEKQNSTATNLTAIQEIARQIRLRNIGGIIIIDALKMKGRADQSKIVNAIKRATETDPCTVQVFGLTKLGLIELTRTRRGPDLVMYLSRV